MRRIVNLKTGKEAKILVFGFSLAYTKIMSMTICQYIKIDITDVTLYGYLDVEVHWSFLSAVNKVIMAVN